MKFTSVTIALLCVMGVTAVKSQAQPPRRLAPDLILSTPISADVANDGATVVADFTEPAVHYIAPDGRLKWSLTAKGSGPGDVLQPYRVALGENTVWIYDFIVRDVSVYSREGTYIRRFRLSLPLAIVDDIVAIGDSALVVLGVTRQAAFANSAIHVFDAVGAHKRSFGEVAFAVDRSRLIMTGTGTLARTAQNTLLYVRKGPYQLLEYGVDGRLRRSVTPPMVIAAVVDSLQRIETNAKGRERITSRAAEIRFPLRGAPLSKGLVLSGVSDRGTSRWWIHPPQGAPVPVSLPGGISPSSWNARTCELVAFTNRDDEPALVAVAARAVFPTATLNAMGCVGRDPSTTRRK